MPIIKIHLKVDILFLISYDILKKKMQTKILFTNLIYFYIVHNDKGLKEITFAKISKVALFTVLTVQKSKK